MTTHSSIIIGILLIILVGTGYLVITSPKAEQILQPTATTTTQQTPAPVTQNVPVSGLQVTAPLANQVVSSPLTITGKANGLWYFEGSFPVKLVDANNTVLGTGIAQSQGEWATTTLTNFSLTLTFVTPQTATGTLIFEKDNPSGLPQNAGTYLVPVQF